MQFGFGWGKGPRVRRQIWKVVKARSRLALENALNELAANGFEIVHVLTEGGHDGYDFTIIAAR
jgi:hypothetical protein